MILLARTRFNTLNIEFEALSESMNEEILNSQPEDNNESQDLNEENKSNIDENDVSAILERDRNFENSQRELKKSSLYDYYFEIAVLCFCLMLIITIITLSCIFLLWEAGGSNLFLFTFEAIVVIVESVHIFSKYVLQISWWNLNDEWDDRSTKFYFIDAILDMATNSLTVVHYFHIWWLYKLNYSFVDLFILMNIRHSVLAVYNAFKSFNSYRSAMATLQSRLADITAEELTTLDDSCAICIGTLDNPKNCKKLPCHHVFHTPCLKKWFKHKRICPNCRTPILPEEAAQVPNAQPLNPNFPGVNAQMMQDIQNLNNQNQGGLNNQQVYNFNSRNISSWLPNVSLQVSQNIYPGNIAQNFPQPIIPPQPILQNQFRQQHIPVQNVNNASSFFNNFSFGSMNSESRQSQLNSLRDMFPHLSTAALEAELIRTGSLDATIDSILNGSLLSENSNSFFPNSNSNVSSVASVSSNSNNSLNISGSELNSNNSSINSIPSASVSNSNDVINLADDSVESIRDRTLQARRAYFDNINRSSN